MAPVRTVYTDDELMRLPRNGHKYEVIGGELAISPAGMEHEGVGVRLGGEIDRFVTDRALGRVYGSSTGYRLPDGDLFSPDVSFVRTERLPSGRSPRDFGTFPPDLAVEILSPSDSRSQVNAKIERHLDWGVRLVWLVDPVARTVTVFRRGAEPRVIPPDGLLDGEDVIPGFTLALERLFA